MERKLVLWLAVGLILLGAALLAQAFFLNSPSPAPDAMGTAVPDQGSPPPNSTASHPDAEGSNSNPNSNPNPNPDSTPTPSAAADEPREPKKPLTREELIDRLWEAYRKTEENFYKPERLDGEKLIEEAIRGMIRGLEDPFSRYNTRKEYQEFTISIEGQYEGIGAYIGLRNGEITVISPIKGGPAERQGVRAGDVILEIDGESTQGFSTDDAAQRLRGPRGTSVTIKVRHLDGSIEEITIVRERIEIPSVETKLLSPEIAYVRLNTFSGTTPQELREKLAELERESSDIQGLVLDLRGNAGGLLQAAKEIASLFLDRGMTILVERTRQGERIHTSFGNRRPNWPIAVLVDEGTASASEILAAAIRDNRLGLLFGRPTFGKGVIQTPIPLSDGSMLILTTAEYLTPNREPVQDVGLTPHVVVEDWFPALTEVRREVQGLYELLPGFAEASRKVLEGFGNLLDRIETHAGRDEYEDALKALEEFEARLRTDPAVLLEEVGISPNTPEAVLMEPLLEKLAEGVRPLLPELRERLERNVIAVAEEWLRTLLGERCPCEFPEVPEPEATAVGAGTPGP